MRVSNSSCLGHAYGSCIDIKIISIRCALERDELSLLFIYVNITINVLLGLILVYIFTHRFSLTDWWGLIILKLTRVIIIF